jgi:hypothetical protein
VAARLPVQIRLSEVAQASTEADGEEGQKFGETLGKLILNDLFIVYFVLKIPIANCPFVVSVCREVEGGPKDYTLDIWAREHFKSTIITIAETIQFTLKNPDASTGIFSYVRPVAKKFLFSIKEAFQNEEIFHICFPDVVFFDCEKEAPLWSLDEGLILRRGSTRKEPNISAWGLTEGMPTGFHLDRRVYDDISTEDMADSVDMMEKVKQKFDSSQNLGMEGGHHRVIGTYYHHADPLTYVRGIKTPEGEPRYHYRFKPGSDDRTATVCRCLYRRSVERFAVDPDQLSHLVLPLADVSSAWFCRSSDDDSRGVYRFCWLTAGDWRRRDRAGTDWTWAVNVVAQRRYRRY